MRTVDPKELQKAEQKAYEKYKKVKDELETLKDEPLAFQAHAQKANDAWLEYKRIEKEVRNCLIIKRMGDLYGCY